MASPSAMLSKGQLALLAQHGEERRAEVGDILFKVGDRRYPLIAIIEGEAAVLDAAGTEIIRHGPSGPAAAAAELADDEAALSSAYLVTAIGSGAMCVWLLADGGDGTGWGLVFGAIAAFQLWRYLRGRG